MKSAKQQAAPQTLAARPNVAMALGMYRDLSHK